MAEVNLLSINEMAAVLEHTPGGLAVYRYDGESIEPLFRNPAFYEMTGQSPDNMKIAATKAVLAKVHPEDAGPLGKKFEHLLACDKVEEHTYRRWNDAKGEYRWIRLKCLSKSGGDGSRLLYCLYDDVSPQKQVEEELTTANEYMQNIVNAIPGGVAIYKVSDIFETVYFSEGVPALSGYSLEEYRELVKRDAAEMTYQEDTEMVVLNAMEVVRSRGMKEFEFRKLHRDGHIVWVNAHVKWIGEDEGCPLLHCVFHNISELKEAKLETDCLVNSIPGGIASYKMVDDRLYPVFFSDGAMALTGHTREELEAMAGNSVFDMIYDLDRERVVNALRSAYASGEVLDISYRMRHKDGNLVWIHLNGRRMGPLSDSARFYAIFTGMSAEASLFQRMVNETADGIYVIDKSNYDLLYANDSGWSQMNSSGCLGKKCYKALYGYDRPCSFCTFNTDKNDGMEHEMKIEGADRFYSARVREMDWNGIPAYVKYVRDVTDEVKIRREKERLEGYFRTVVEQLPGGISVILRSPDGVMTPELISDGLAAMLHMTADEVRAVYANDKFAGIYADDIREDQEKLKAYAQAGQGHCEFIGRMKCGDGGYIWVKLLLSVRDETDGARRLYAVYTDITGTIEEKEKLLLQYEEQLYQHHHRPGPDVLVTGHCSITENRILEITDYTDSDLLQSFGHVRETFFTRVADFIEDEKERQIFLSTYLNEPMKAAYERKDTEQILPCFVKLPGDVKGRYVQFKVNLLEAPDTGDITGILTVTDITEKIISERILHRLSVQGHDVVVDLDMEQDTYRIINREQTVDCSLQPEGSLSERVQSMVETAIVPRDREQYARGLNSDEMRRRLEQEDFYTFAYSITDKNGDVRTKNMTVSNIDRRLGRACLVCTDITDSVREQQGLLNMIAYTFELAGFLNINDGRFLLYTRQAVLENLPPYILENYNHSVKNFMDSYVVCEGRESTERQFRIETMLSRLEEEPGGYDFVVSHQEPEGLRYKQVNVLWGDQNHRTICIVRADVTDMLAEERRTKAALEKALTLAEAANVAKSDFLSAMSHDIRTPMNAIMGMTTLACAHLDERERVEEYLKKITVASRHLLSLINDVLDMSRIERSKITLNTTKIYLPQLLDQISDIIELQAREEGLQFQVRSQGISHPGFYGDFLRISQIMINLLSNAVKFTLKGGSVDFLAEEIPPVDHRDGWVRFRFTVCDTGIGIAKENLERIFAPFVRNSGTERIEGTGLGLSITKGLVELMEGRISVESQAGKGSRFQVELELQIAEDVKSSGMSHETHGQNRERKDRFEGCRFLVAEDNDINAEILCEMLAMNGAEGVVRKDGAQAVEAFRESQAGDYDGILMDIQMPEMNGYEATRRIRSMERADAETIPIIAMTANAFAEDIQASADAGMTAHVSKPVDMDVLWDTLSRVLKK